MCNDYLQNTTAEQRRSIRSYIHWRADQGYYPWARAPFGFDKTRMNGKPTLELNSAGVSIAAAFNLVAEGEIRSARELATFLTTAIGKPVNAGDALWFIQNQNFNGRLNRKGTWIKGRFKKPVSDSVFAQVQAITSQWGKK